MKFKKILLIVNPKAGLTKHRYNIFDIIESFCERDCITTTLSTLKEGDAIKYVRENAAEHEMVVCAGGDGTLNETVSALMEQKLNIPIGYIPSGSTNDMARTLDIPTKPKKAAELIMDGEPKPFDVGKFGENRYFCYTASFGAFTRISYSTPTKLKNIFGHSAYVLNGIAKAGQELVPLKASIKTETENFEGEFILGGLFNARSVAGLVKLDKCDVKLDDGLFELFLIRMPKNLESLDRIIKNINRQNFTDDAIILRRVKWAEFTFEKPTAWSLDGESGGETTKIMVENMHHAVNIFGKKD